MRGNSNRFHSSSSDKELALSWHNQGRLHAGEAPKSEPFEWMITVLGPITRSILIKNPFMTLGKMNCITMIDTDMWCTFECQKLV